MEKMSDYLLAAGQLLRLEETKKGIDLEKERKQLAQEKNPGLDKRLLMIPPVDLDQLITWYAPLMAKGGNNLLTVP